MISSDETERRTDDYYQEIVVALNLPTDKDGRILPPMPLWKEICWWIKKWWRS